LSGSGKNTYNDRPNFPEITFYLALTEKRDACFFEIILGRNRDMRLGMGSARSRTK
jgi:hypothetical protein